MATYTMLRNIYEGFERAILFSIHVEENASGVLTFVRLRSLQIDSIEGPLHKAGRTVEN